MWSAEKLRRVGVVCLVASVSVMVGNVIGKYEGRWEVEGKGPPMLGGEVLADVVSGEQWALLMDRAALRREVKLLKGRVVAVDGSWDGSEMVSALARLEARQEWLEGVVGELRAGFRSLGRELECVGGD